MSRLSLPGVALRAATSIAIPETMRAIERCIEKVKFGSVQLLSDWTGCSTSNPEIRLMRIDPIRSRREYSEFVIRKLVDHVAEPHVLLVQWDSFVIDHSQWSDEFLRYDYIGAPWPQFDDERTVGNGGFSLRSHRLLQLTASPDFPGTHPEDVSICRIHRAALEGQGLSFAPPEVAERFSFERGPAHPSFGFHGLFNFPLVLSDEDLRRTLEQLDPRLLCGRDGADLIAELARRRDWRLACRLARRRLLQRSGGASDLRLAARMLTHLVSH